MRVPLSWLRDFAPFAGDAASIWPPPSTTSAWWSRASSTWARAWTTSWWPGSTEIAADRRRRPDPPGRRRRRRRPVEVVCGAGTSRSGDLVPLAPVGAVLPGGFAIGRRKMKGVVSNGMLCSGRELRLSEDHEGILVLDDVDGARARGDATDVLGIEPDVVFDIAVEANRPDAWCMAGVARDLAARLGLPFAVPPTPAWSARVARTGRGRRPPDRPSRR